jgi:carbonic anhydrase/acetyltransferase-like protein (isoleucine patch superfamily)
MNSVLMDHVVIGDESIVGALTMIKEGEQIPPRSVVVGNPGKIIRTVSDEMLTWKTKGTQLYQALPAQCKKELKRCTPLRKPRAQKPNRKVDYKSWKKTTR